MSDLFWVSQSKLARITWYFPLSHGIARVDDHGVVSGIINVIRNGFYAGAMRRAPMARTRPCTTALYDGVA